MALLLSLSLLAHVEAMGPSGPSCEELCGDLLAAGGTSADVERCLRDRCTHDAASTNQTCSGECTDQSSCGGGCVCFRPGLSEGYCSTPSHVRDWLPTLARAACVIVAEEIDERLLALCKKRTARGVAEVATSTTTLLRGARGCMPEQQRCDPSDPKLACCMDLSCVRSGVADAGYRCMPPPGGIPEIAATAETPPPSDPYKHMCAPMPRFACEDTPAGMVCQWCAATGRCISKQQRCAASAAAPLLAAAAAPTDTCVAQNGRCSAGGAECCLGLSCADGLCDGMAASSEAVQSAAGAGAGGAGRPAEYSAGEGHDAHDLTPGQVYPLREEFPPPSGGGCASLGGSCGTWDGQSHTCCKGFRCKSVVPGRRPITRSKCIAAQPLDAATAPAPRS